ncbi:MAG: tRNA-dihydrouridine synthase [Candidatus Levybacteria bacterium]|nr:tRNA-dihydrouridine synthase [Candidatus Levybacteria bacterium]
MGNFWKKLSKPFTVLAPMDGVTDTVFRQIINSIGRPDVFFTEFVNCEGLLSAGKKVVAERLKYVRNEQPIVAQIWGVKPDSFRKVAQYIRKLGFAGIDINMGCPDRAVIRDGACAGLIKNPNLAQKIIQAAKKGADGLPVSVKTRIGFHAEDIEEWIGFLLKQDLSAISIHLRTVRELSKVPAHWELMPKIMELRNKIAPKTFIIGNGDIKSLAEVKEKHKLYGCDGYMIGTGIFANPWLFNSSVKLEDIVVKERLNLYLKHIDLFSKTWGESKNPATLKKFCKTYVNNFSGAVSLREKIMLSKSLKELRDTITTYISPNLPNALKFLP